VLTWPAAWPGGARGVPGTRARAPFKTAATGAATCGGGVAGAAPVYRMSIDTVLINKLNIISLY